MKKSAKASPQNKPRQCGGAAAGRELLIRRERLRRTQRAAAARPAHIAAIKRTVMDVFVFLLAPGRYIKMSSPYLNNMIIIGCLLTYTSVILLGLDSHLTSEAALPVICTARIWTLMAGFTLAFGSMFSKTWRVHSIFTDVKLNKKVSSFSLFLASCPAAGPAATWPSLSPTHSAPDVYRQSKTTNCSWWWACC